MQNPDDYILHIKSHPDTNRRPLHVLNALKIFFPMDVAIHCFLQLEAGSTAEVTLCKTHTDLAILRRRLHGQGFVIDISATLPTESGFAPAAKNARV